MNLHAVMWWGVGRTLLAGLTRATTSIKVYGAERIPREGGAVLAVNHIHWVDIPVIGATCPRRISYLAKAEVDAVPGLLAPSSDPSGRSSCAAANLDRDAVRLAREAVRNNLLLGMFVEGTRQRDGRPGRQSPVPRWLRSRREFPSSPPRSTGRSAGGSACHGPRSGSPGASRCGSASTRGTRRDIARQPRKSKRRSGAYGSS